MPPPAHNELSRPGGRRRWSDFVHRRHRISVAAVILALFFAGLLVLGIVQPGETAELLAKSDPVESLYQALLTATVTGVTLVLTICQLVLSQELGAIGDQRQRLQGALEFKQDFEAIDGQSPAPAEPSRFFIALLDAVRERADSVQAALSDTDHNEAGTISFLNELTEDARQLTDKLEDAEFGRFEVVWHALGFDYSTMIHRTRRMLSERESELGDEGSRAARELADLLEMFGAAREHFKTLFFQWQLTDLSIWIMASAVPAILASTVMIAYFQPQNFSGRILGIGTAHLVVSASTTLSLAPFAVLISYMARIMSVTQRTLSIGPFILRTTGE